MFPFRRANDVRANDYSIDEHAKCFTTRLYIYEIHALLLLRTLSRCSPKDVENTI